MKSDIRSESHLINYFPVKSALTWDEYFMLQAMLASFKSKDPNTKVGCVVVDSNNHQISMGYNGFVAGIDESQLPWGNDKSVPIEHQKYGYVVHSEANALMHATRPLKGAKVYVTLFPCQECAKLIASQGVSEVIYLSDKYGQRDESRMAKKIFALAGVRYRGVSIDDKLILELKNYLEDLISEL